MFTISLISGIRHSFGVNQKVIASAGAAGAGLVVLAVLIQGGHLMDTADPLPVTEKAAPPPGAATPTEEAVTIMETDGVLHTIPLEKIKSGGPPKDGIPSIDEPVFVAAADADFLSDSDTVIGLNLNGDARAYPLLILVWHEIVNDEVGGIPVAVTYCPLCYTSQVFERVIQGEAVEFGTTGKLYQSNLLMYDRLTDTYWSQVLGTAVKGPLSGDRLERVPFDIVSWGDWKVLHPETVVLSTDTGHIRSYGVDPYGTYYTDPRIIFPVDNPDDRMHPKEIVIGLGLGGVHKAYRQADIESAVAINDSVGGTDVLLLSMFPGNTRAFDRVLDGQVLSFVHEDGRVTDLGSGSEWNYDGLAISGSLAGEQLERLAIEPGFWFEWATIYPDTLIYGDGV